MHLRYLSRLDSRLNLGRTGGYLALHLPYPRSRVLEHCGQWLWIQLTLGRELSCDRFSVRRDVLDIESRRGECIAGAFVTLLLCGTDQILNTYLCFLTDITEQRSLDPGD